VKYTPQLPESNVNVTPRSPLREFFLLTAGLLATIVALYIFLGIAVDLLTPRMSTDLENKVGALFFSGKEADTTASKKQQFLQSLVDTFQDQCTSLPYRFTVHIQDSPQVNALALPGGHIIVFSGLVDAVTSENELAFVLAHEMGHYAHRDHLRGLGRGLVFLIISAVLFGPDSTMGTMLGNALNITELTFSRKQETHADEFAVEALNCVYGHTAGATDFFEKIPREQDSGRFGHYFSTHPERRRRIFHLLEFMRSQEFSMAERKPLPDYWTEGE
jgi:Zn-dependent protease with chaperone function